LGGERDQGTEISHWCGRDEVLTIISIGNENREKEWAPIRMRNYKTPVNTRTSSQGEKRGREGTKGGCLPLD